MILSKLEVGATGVSKLQRELQPQNVKILAFFSTTKTFLCTIFFVAGDVLGSANTGNRSEVYSTDGSIPLIEIRSEKPRNRA